MPTVTFTVTDTEEKIDLASRLLESNQVQFTKGEDERERRLEKHKALAKHYRETPYLTGHGEELARMRKEFREDFVL